MSSPAIEVPQRDSEMSGGTTLKPQRRAWSVHLGMFAIGLLLVAGGILGVSHPRKIALEHPRHGRRGLLSQPDTPEMLTENATRVYGLVTLAVGLVMVRLAFMKNRDRE